MLWLMSTHNIRFHEEIRKTFVQSMVSLTSSLEVKMLTVLVSNSPVILLKNAKATHIFFRKILAYMPYLMIKVLTIR